MAECECRCGGETHTNPDGSWWHVHAQSYAPTKPERHLRVIEAQEDDE